MIQLWLGLAVGGAVLLAGMPTVTHALFHKSEILPVVTAAWFMLLAGIAIFGYVWLTKGSEKLFNPLAMQVAGLGGLTFGAVANVMIFQAFALAPNPGLPLAIVAGNGIFAVLAARGLYSWLPTYFDAVELKWGHAIGAALILAGVVVIQRVSNSP